VIRNVVIHVSNEQPLLADLYGPPDAGDVGLVCTNVRMLDGKRPIFIDSVDSTFFFPYLHVRFVEIPAAEMRRHVEAGGAAPGSSATGVAFDDPDQRLPAVLDVPVEALAPDEDIDLDLDIDESFLQRVRDI
jgi:hypothetical protein